MDHVIAMQVESSCARDVTCDGSHQSLRHSLASGIQYGSRACSFATNDDFRLKEVNIRKKIQCSGAVLAL